MKDFSNVTTESLGQNGYCKFPNGILMQWGTKASDSYAGDLVLPLSFLDTNYSLQFACGMVSYLDTCAWIVNYYNTKVNSFFYHITYQDGADAGHSSAVFRWMAIGRWK